VAKTLPMNVSIVDTNEATGLQPGLTLKVSTLPLVKRGDFVRLMVKYQDGQAKTKEIITCLVTQAAPDLIQCKVFSAPALTHFHTIEYGDDLTVPERCVIEHESSDAKRVESLEHFLTGVIPPSSPLNAEDAKLRQAAQDLPAIPPQTGRQMWLRNGTVATVWAFFDDRQLWEGTADGARVEWKADGSHAGGIRDLDIVREPVNV
jgi:hypothetical protein